MCGKGQQESAAAVRCELPLSPSSRPNLLLPLPLRPSSRFLTATSPSLDTLTPESPKDLRAPPATYLEARPLAHQLSQNGHLRLTAFLRMGHATLGQGMEPPRRLVAG